MAGDTHATVAADDVANSALYPAEQTDGLVFHPFDQFIVEPLFHSGPVGIFTITNATLWMFFAVVVIFLVMAVGSSKRAIVPGRGQSIGELVYGLIHKMIVDVAGKEALVFFPYVMTLFLFIVTANLLGLLPLSYTPTSHFAVTVMLALSVFLTVTVVGFAKHGTKFLELFWIKSAPLAIRPILAIVEVISYFIRPVSHSIRLGGNILAGHAVIKVFAAFASITLISPVAVVAITALYGLEVLVAVVQAYVFTILTCVYLKDAMHPSH